MTPKPARSLSFACLLGAVAAGVLAARPLEARVDVTLDAETLNGFLSEAGPSRFQVQTPLGPLQMELSELRVTGFDPAAGNPGAGWIRTSARLRVPKTALDTRLEPRVSLEVREREGAKSCYLKFEKVELDLQGMGRLDVASMLPPIQLAPNVSWVMPTAQGPKRVRPRLMDARVGAQSLRLSFDLDIGPDSDPAKGGLSPSK